MSVTAAHGARDAPGPSGLVRGSETRAVVPVKILVEQQVVLPSTVALEKSHGLEAKPTAIRANEENGDRPLLKILGYRHAAFFGPEPLGYSISSCSPKPLSTGPSNSCPAEQAVLARLSLFSGSFDLEAAEAVCSSVG